LANSFFTELKRRNVFKVGTAYLVLAWVVIQVTDTAVPALHLPEWINSAVFFFGAIGFPFALFFAWAFEITPDGVKKESDIAPEDSITAHAGQKLNYIIIGLLVIALGYFIYESRFESQPERNAVTENASVKVEPETTKNVTQEAKGSSIAVLPFVNMSSDKEQEYFSDGITEEILNVLAKIPKLHVTSRSSAFAFKGKEINITDVAEKLGVNNILEGSVRKSGNRIRITAQLIDARTDTHLWSETYERELVDIFAIQDEISQSIAIVLKDVLGGNKIKNNFPTSNLEAYELFLKGRLAFHKRGDSLDLAIDSLKKATEIDPEFADAWIYLAGSAAVAIGYNTKINDDDARKLANEAIKVAFQLKPNSSLANAIYGWIHDDDNKWEEALVYYRKAVKLDPTNSTAQLWLGIELLLSGHIQKAKQHLEKAFQSDPLVGVNNGYLGLAYLSEGQYERGYAHIIKSLDLNWRVAYDFIFPVLIQQKLDKNYKDLVNKYLLSTNKPVNKNTVLYLHLISELKPGQENSAKLTALHKKNPELFTSNDYLNFGYIDEFFEHANLELSERTFNKLDSLVYTRKLWLPQNKIVREDPRLIDLLNRFGIVDFWKAEGFPDGCSFIETEPQHLKCD